MIVTMITGGLGNQLFRYAAARRLAYVNQVDLKLDITPYINDKLRKFVLADFNIKAQIATNEEVERFTRPKNLFLKISAALIPSLPKESKYYYKEKFYHFDPEVLRLSDDVYLSGYWQSEKYFLDIQDILKREFTLRNPPPKNFIKLSKQIKATNSVSIHIRRGDYVEDKKTFHYHGFFGTEYIQTAIAIIINKLPNPHFYIFSDDIDWVKHNLIIKYPTTLINKKADKNDCEDLILMSLCRHNIIVNSSFGWWGAWLNRNKTKIVITPREWYQKGPEDTKDLIPGSWIRI